MRVSIMTERLHVDNPLVAAWSGDTGRPTTADFWLDECLERVNDLARMPLGWDSYGSPTIAPEAVETAVELLHKLALLSAPKPHIVPISGGGLQLDWAVNNRELEIGVRATGHLEYLLVLQRGIKGSRLKATQDGG